METFVTYSIAYFERILYLKPVTETVTRHFFSIDVIFKIVVMLYTVRGKEQKKYPLSYFVFFILLDYIGRS